MGSRQHGRRPPSTLRLIAALSRCVYIVYDSCDIPIQYSSNPIIIHVALLPFIPISARSSLYGLSLTRVVAAVFDKPMPKSEETGAEKSYNMDEIHENETSAKKQNSEIQKLKIMTSLSDLITEIEKQQFPHLHECCGAAHHHHQDAHV